MDECLSQITHNAVALIEGDPSQRADHLQQLRAGLGRIQRALKRSEGRLPEPPAELRAGLATWLKALGPRRQAAAAISGVPKAPARRSTLGPRLEIDDDPSSVAALCRSEPVQALLLGWIRWMVSLQAQGTARRPSLSPPARKAPGRAVRRN